MPNLEVIARVFFEGVRIFDLAIHRELKRARFLPELD
jgi:hypothetical protein